MVTKKEFGVLDHKQISMLTIQNERMRVEMLDYGATIRSIWVKDRNGNDVDVCLGYDTLEEYRSNDGYLGATIGRNSNRIANSEFSINGKVYCLTENEGENQLHGGLNGFDRKVWDYRLQENGVTFSLDSPDGEEGYPGNLHAEVTYRLEDSTLHIEYRASCDQDTVVNLTNHAYFNLGGQESGRIDNHILKVPANCYTPVDEALIPTGEIAPVNGTALDLREGVTMHSVFEQEVLAATNGLDHNVMLDPTKDYAAVLWCPGTGIGLEVKTTLEGMQIYSCGAMTKRVGKNGASYDMHHAVCLETQHFPDAVHHPNFPTSILRCGEIYEEKTSYRFFAND